MTIQKTALLDLDPNHFSLRFAAVTSKTNNTERILLMNPTVGPSVRELKFGFSRRSSL